MTLKSTLGFVLYRIGAAGLLLFAGDILILPIFGVMQGTLPRPIENIKVFASDSGSVITRDAIVLPLVFIVLLYAGTRLSPQTKQNLKRLTLSAVLIASVFLLYIIMNI